MIKFPSKTEDNVSLDGKSKFQFQTSVKTVSNEENACWTFPIAELLVIGPSSSTKVSQMKKKWNGATKKRERKKVWNEETWFITYRIQCLAETKNLYSPTVSDGIQRNTGKNDVLFQAKADSYVLKIKRKINPESPVIYKKNGTWFVVKKKKKFFDSGCSIAQYAHSTLFIQDDVLHLFSLLVTFQDFPLIDGNMFFVWFSLPNCLTSSKLDLHIAYFITFLCNFCFYFSLISV